MQADMKSRKDNLSDELTVLEMSWLEKLQPFGEKGYNLNSNIRQA
jgi:hypothetical protein